MVPAGPREADPIAGKAPSIDLTVRAAYDAEFVYLSAGRLKRRTQSTRCGAMTASSGWLGPFFNPPKPQFMYDEKVVGFRAIPEGELQARMGQAALIEKKNAVALDPNTKFAIGDLLPQYLQREPEGSGADVQAFGRYVDGHWVVELRRKLNTGHPDDKVLRPGRAYPIGFAIFDDTVSNRRHYVTLPMSLGLGTSGDVTAAKVGP